MKGKLIKSPTRIIELADARKSVSFHHMVIPAAVVQNWQLRFIVTQIKLKNLFEYKAKNENS